MVLQIIALVFAFSIRKVKVKGLNTSKFIGAAVYVISIVLAVIIVIVYTLSAYINAYSIILSSGYLIGATVILILVFIPLVSIEFHMCDDCHVWLPFCVNNYYYATLLKLIVTPKQART